MRKLTSRNFSWRNDGAVQAYFLPRVIPEFFNGRFDLQGDEFRFVGGALSASSMVQLKAAIRRLAAEFELYAHQDARLSLDERPPLRYPRAAVLGILRVLQVTPREG